MPRSARARIRSTRSVFFKATPSVNASGHCIIAWHSNMLGKGARLPLVVDAGASGHAAVLESDLYSATAFGIMQRRVVDSPLRPLTESKGAAGAKITPWRVILLGDNALFTDFAARGAMGIKYGFMGDKPEFTRSAMAAAAKEKLMINFHDGPTPMTGVERTLPNLVAREYCHAQQDRRSAFTPQAFLKMAFINNLTCPLDMCNGTYGLNDITRRAKGPKNPLNATVVAATARTAIIYSGLISLPDGHGEKGRHHQGHARHRRRSLHVDPALKDSFQSA